MDIGKIDFKTKVITGDKEADCIILKEAIGNGFTCGKCTPAPIRKASECEVWQAGSTPTDRFSHGESGLHCI